MVIKINDFNATIENPAITQFLKSGLLLDHAKKKNKSSSHWKAELVPGALHEIERALERGRGLLAQRVG